MHDGRWISDSKLSFQSFAPTPIRKFSLGPELLIKKKKNSCNLEEINMSLLKIMIRVKNRELSFKNYLSSYKDHTTSTEGKF